MAFHAHSLSRFRKTFSSHFSATTFGVEGSSKWRLKVFLNPEKFENRPLGPTILQIELF